MMHSQECQSFPCLFILRDVEKGDGAKKVEEPTLSILVFDHPIPGSLDHPITNVS